MPVTEIYFPVKREISLEESVNFIEAEKFRLYKDHLGFYYWKRGFHPVWIDTRDDSFRIADKVRQMKKDET